MVLSASSRSLVLTGLVGVIVGAAAGYLWRGETLAPAAPARLSTPAQAPGSDAAKALTGAAPEARESGAEESSRTEVVDFDAAIRSALDDRDELQSGIRVRQLIRALDPADIGAAVEQVKRLADEDCGQIL